MPQLPKQPRVLHRDHRLSREVLQQCYLFVRKRAYLLAVNHDTAEQDVIFEERHDECCSRAAEIGDGAAVGVAVLVERLGHHIQDMDGVAGFNEPRHGATAPRSWRVFFSELSIGSGNAALSRRLEPVTVIRKQRSKRGPAQPHRLLQHCIEHRRQITGRGIDNLQHLRDRCLLFQRLALLGQQPRILQRDHRLMGEAFQQRNLLFGKRTDLKTVRADKPEQRAVLAQRHLEKRPDTRQIKVLAPCIVKALRLDSPGIRDVVEAFPAHQCLLESGGRERPAHHFGQLFR